MKLQAIMGDITKFQADAIVNAANESLLGGGGVDGAIHRAAGHELLAECRTIGGCPTGEVRKTGAYRLPAKYILHTVGPIWYRLPKNTASGLLADCYRNCLTLAEELGCRSIAFPSISTGAYAFPVERAAKIAVTTILEYARRHPDSCIEDVTVVCFGKNTWDFFQREITAAETEAVHMAADVHMHIVWGVDDGAENEEMAKDMLRLAHEEGIRCICASSHGSAQFPLTAAYTAHLARLQKYAAAHYPDMKICAATEIRVHEGEEKLLLEHLRNGRLHYLGGSKKILAELSVHAPLESNLSVVRNLMNAGLEVVVAHAERYQHFCEDMDAIAKLVQDGCQIQINAFSLAESTDEITKEWARELVRRKLVHYIGTDAHRTTHRPPSMKQGLEWLYANTDAAYADAISFSNAQAFFTEEKVPPEKPEIPVFSPKPSREQLAEVFQDTLDMMREIPSLKAAAADARARTEIHFPDAPLTLPECPDYDTTIHVSMERSLAAAKKLKAAYPDDRIGVLNFASAARPGGGVLRGAGAQEECLCRCSTLYECLNTKEMWAYYYAPNRARNDRMNTDTCIYSPDVTVCRTDTSIPQRMAEADWYKVDILTCAAPDFRMCMTPTEERQYAMHCSRARRILSTAAHHGITVLVLGAFGCGAFRNTPAAVAKAYRDVLKEYAGCFRHVEFAVYCSDRERENYTAFAEILNHEAE